MLVLCIKYVRMYARSNDTNDTLYTLLLNINIIMFCMIWFSWHFFSGWLLLLLAYNVPPSVSAMSKWYMLWIHTSSDTHHNKNSFIFTLWIFLCFFFIVDFHYSIFLCVCWSFLFCYKTISNLFDCLSHIQSPHTHIK